MAISKSDFATAFVGGALLVLSAGLAACHAHPASDGAANEKAANEKEGASTAETVAQNRPKLGLMTSLPIYWPLDADLSVLASGTAQVPWQRAVLERRFELVPVDTLSPIAALARDADPIDPLGELEFLAVIQPRVLTPSDNVALDDWVRGGGQLLLVLDPALDGHYALPLGDPRRPVEAALIPPVLARWGLEMRFDEIQIDEAQNAPAHDGARDGAREARIGDVVVPLHMAGTLLANSGLANSGLANSGRESARSDGECTITADKATAQCTLGEGRVTLFADAEIFKGDHADIPEHGGHEGPDHGTHTAADELKGTAIQALAGLAFDPL